MTNYITDEGDSLDVEPLLPFYLGCAGHYCDAQESLVRMPRQ